MLEAAGNLENLRIAAGRSSGRYQGPVFMDSDVYKWIEAAAYEHARVPSDWLLSHMATAIDIVGAAQGAGRLPELPLSGRGAGPALDRFRPGARALLRGTPLPGRGGAPPGDRHGRPPPDRPPLRGLSRGPLRPRQAPGDARPPRDRDGAHRALPGDRRSALRRARAVLPRPARARLARPGAVQQRRVLPGPRPGARGERARGPRRPRAVPDRRHRGRVPRDRGSRAPAARSIVSGRISPVTSST